MEVVHQAGKKHAHADAMTRPPVARPEVLSIEGEQSNEPRDEESRDEEPRDEESRDDEQRKETRRNKLNGSKIDIAKFQREDLDIAPYIEYLERNVLPEKEVLARQISIEAGRMWIDEEGRLYRSWWP